MQKFGPKSQNLSEISGFENIVRLRFRITLHLDFWALPSTFARLVFFDPSTPSMREADDREKIENNTFIVLINP